jgi:hypothetical protein
METKETGPGMDTDAGGDLSTVRAQGPPKLDRDRVDRDQCGVTIPSTVRITYTRGGSWAIL